VCLCEIIPCVLLTCRVGVYWGVARVCPSHSQVTTGVGCTWLYTSWMPIKGSNTRVRSRSYLLRVLFIVTVRLRWRLIMMTAVIESDWLRDYLSALRSDWFFLVLVTFWQIIHCSLQTKTNNLEMRAVAEKPHDAVVKFDTYRNVQRRSSLW